MLIVAGTGLSAPGLVPEAGAQDRALNVKLATLAPRGSVWHDLLLEMAAAWSEASNGQVTLTIYPSGVAGEEADVLRKMRIGQLHAGALSLAGLQGITSSVVVLAIPLIMETPEDLARVRAVMEPRLEEVFEEKGYIVLQWGDVGWVHYFLPEPDPSVEALKRYKYVSWSDDATTSLWEKAGFRQVVLNLSDVLTGLQTGLVDALGTTPLFVLANQWFPFVPYMADLPLFPLAGATLIDKRVWERVPAEVRPELMRISRAFGDRIQEEVVRLEAQAIEEMEARGLTVVELSPEAIEEWRTLFRSAWPQLRGPVVPEDWFDEAVRLAGEGEEGAGTASGSINRHMEEAAGGAGQGPADGASREKGEF